jgi:exodeoxyribonuclease V gamma subunit
MTPGFMVLHGNRLEALRDLVMEWQRVHPLSPFDDEVMLVQSNGIAQWIKLALARPEDEGGLGIAAGISVELPARFLWRTYRCVLGEARVHDESPFSKARLGWRILRLLPPLLDAPEMAPVKRYVEDDADLRKLHALAERIADLLDGYQVYRADWLADWAAGRDVLRDDLRHPGEPLAVPEAQRWQPALWRAILADMRESREGSPALEQLHRAAIHEAFLARMTSGVPVPGLPPRIVVFGISSLPQQTLEALAALSRHSQVILTVLNPCQHYWADIVEARDLLRAGRRRHGRKPGMPETLRFEDVHRHGNPLLASWGRQGRDFIRLLDHFDDPDAYRNLFETAGRRIDLFETPGGDRLLASVQRAILELEPVPAPGSAATVAADDASIQFHVCNSPQREVEVLHDRLLAMFDAAAADGNPLDPRDIIVMVPDIEVYAPIVDAVFGAFSADDRRYIPYSLADRTARRSDPVAMAAEALLSLPDSRLPVSQLLDLLDVPAVAARFGIEAGSVPVLRAWIEGAGIRWGLDAAHRGAHKVPDAGQQNTWVFGLRRMLLGYLAGHAVTLDGIEPYAEVGGLEADVAGGFADLVEAVAETLPRLAATHSPQAWGDVLRDTLERFLLPSSDAELATVERIRQGVTAWLDACEQARLATELPVNVVREAILAGLDQVRLTQRFMGGAVSFATLMPMRAIPFRAVCMLGMNDADYPRTRNDSDFDLMALPGTSRPGDRSRRDDDRYLFLEALLSARDTLYIGWCGRSARDNSPRPPSVLVAQLRDYLAAGWRADGDDTILQQLTVQHPLQPFSLRYFRAPSAQHFTYAAEWQVARDAEPTKRTSELAFQLPARLPARALGEFLAHPVKAFFVERLGVRFDGMTEAGEDHEPFGLDPLERYTIAAEIVRTTLADAQRPTSDAASDAAERVRRSGRLPIGALGEAHARHFAALAADVAGRYREIAGSCVRHPVLAAVAIGGTRVELEDAVLLAQPDGALLRLTWSPNSLVTKKGALKHERLICLWTEHLVAHAAGHAVTTRVVAPGADVVLRPLPEGTDVAACLAPLVAAFEAGMRAPLPLARRSAMAWLRCLADPRGNEGKALGEAQRSYDGTGFGNGTPPECTDPYLARMFSDFAALDGAGFTRWAPLLAPVVQLAELVVPAAATEEVAA